VAEFDGQMSDHLVPRRYRFFGRSAAIGRPRRRRCGYCGLRRVEDHAEGVRAREASGMTASRETVNGDDVDVDVVGRNWA
jgi:hypothetical protein